MGRLWRPIENAADQRIIERRIYTPGDEKSRLASARTTAEFWIIAPTALPSPGAFVVRAEMQLLMAHTERSFQMALWV